MLIGQLRWVKNTPNVIRGKLILQSCESVDPVVWVDVPVYDYEVLQDSEVAGPLSQPVMPEPPPVYLSTLATNELFSRAGHLSLEIYRVVPSHLNPKKIAVAGVYDGTVQWFDPGTLVHRVPLAMPLLPPQMPDAAEECFGSCQSGCQLSYQTGVRGPDAKDQEIPQPLGAGQFDTRDPTRPQSDMEHTTRRYWHLSELMRGFAAGILKADPWYIGYQLPPNYEKVLNELAYHLQQDCPGEPIGEVAIASLAEIEEWFIRHTRMYDEFMAWNVDPSVVGPSVKFVTRDTPTQERREFIDLDAITQGVITTLRDWRRHEDARERMRNDPKPCAPGTGE